jgi:ATP-dependent DNA ligase
MDFLDSFINMEPMKYYDADDLSVAKAQAMMNNENKNYFAMEKRDGEWARAIILKDKVIIQSRSISKVTGTYGDKTELVPHIAEELIKNYPAGTVLLGELAFQDVTTTSREVGAILRCNVEKCLTRQQDRKIHFYIFDCLAYNFKSLMDLPFENRFKKEYITPSSLLKMRDPMAQYIHQVDLVDNDFMNFADTIWAQNSEGIIIVKKSMIYEPGKRRAWETLKIKKKLGDIDALIIDTIEPNKLYAGTEIEGWPYTINGVNVTKPYYFGWRNGVVVSYEGRIIKVSSGLTDEDRAWLATDAAKQAIEAKTIYANITGMEMTEDSIRHPVFLGFKNK